MQFTEADNVDNIVAVVLDGKRVLTAIAASEEEGWVELELPVLPQQAFEGKSEMDLPEGGLEYRKERRTGKVQILRK